jgi:hypothetical protein
VFVAQRILSAKYGILDALQLRSLNAYGPIGLLFIAQTGDRLFGVVGNVTHLPMVTS